VRGRVFVMLRGCWNSDTRQVNHKGATACFPHGTGHAAALNLASDGFEPSGEAYFAASFSSMTIA